MPCILWISCDCSSKALIDEIKITPFKTIEKGETVKTREGEKYYERTLCGFDVSKQDFTDFKLLTREATEWMNQNFVNLSRLKTIEASSRLDFGFYSEFIDTKIVAQYNTIPHELSKMAGDLEIDIELSQYWYSTNQGAQLN